MKKKKIGFAIMACFASLLFFCGVPLGNLYYSMATVNAAYMGEVSTAKQEADRLQSESAAAEAKKAEEEAKKQAEEDIKTQEEEKKKRDAEIAAAAKKAAEEAKKKSESDYKEATKEDDEQDGEKNKPSGGTEVPVVPDVPDDSSGSDAQNGWQTINGQKYYYQDGSAVKGATNIGGKYYYFDGSTGALADTKIGIDVSKWQGDINWEAVKASGVDFVMIRAGNRLGGTDSGAGVDGIKIDPKFHDNMQGAIAAGLEVGMYFYSQAITVEEARQEAQFCLVMAKNYNFTLPIAMDVEAETDYRAYGLSADTRTELIKVFCETIKAGGYKTMIYANRDWLTSFMHFDQLTMYPVWLAEWMPTPTKRFNPRIWQFTNKGSFNGISGRVDTNFMFK